MKQTIDRSVVRGVGGLRGYEPSERPVTNIYVSLRVRSARLVCVFFCFFFPSARNVADGGLTAGARFFPLYIHSNRIVAHLAPRRRRR